MDLAETENDAVETAIRDQERAGVDLISDGEMRRQGFIVSIFKYFRGLRPLEPRRKVGVLAYDGHVLYEPVERISAPDGLGTLKELDSLRQATTRPFKITLPGPLTLATQIRKGGPYRDRLEVAADLAPILNQELRTLAARGARNLQLDDVYQSFLMEPKRLVELYDRCFEGVAVERRFWHICFGTLEGFGFGERSYRPLFPAIASACAGQLVLEFANREMAESGLWREFDCSKELGAGVLDLKNFYVESAELVARRIRRVLETVPAERPDRDRGGRPPGPGLKEFPPPATGSGRSRPAPGAPSKRECCSSTSGRSSTPGPGPRRSARPSPSPRIFSINASPPPARPGRRSTSRSRTTRPSSGASRGSTSTGPPGSAHAIASTSRSTGGSSPRSGRPTWGCGASAPLSSPAAGSTARRGCTRSTSTGPTSCWRRRPTRSTSARRRARSAWTSPRPRSRTRSSPASPAAAFRP